MLTGLGVVATLNDTLLEPHELGCILGGLHRFGESEEVYQAPTLALGQTFLGSRKPENPNLEPHEDIVVAGTLRLHDLNEWTRRYSLTNNSPVEAVKAIYREFGLEGLTRLRGDFSIALYDRQLDRLILLRDPTGQRTLYYTALPHRLLASTRPAGLFGHPSLERKIDLPRLGQSAALVHLYPEESLFEGVKRLPSDKMLVLQNGVVTLLPGWKPQIRRSGYSLTQTESLEGFRHHWERAVSRRVDPESGKTALYMSGGLDSAGMACALRSVPILGLCSVPTPGAKLLDSAMGRIQDESGAAGKLSQRLPLLEAEFISSGDLSPLTDLEDSLHLTEQLNWAPLSRPWIESLMNRAAELGYRSVMVGQAGNLCYSYSGNGVMAELFFSRQWLSLIKALLRGRSRGFLKTFARELFDELPLRPWKQIRAWLGREQSYYRQVTFLRDSFLNSIDLDKILADQFFGDPAKGWRYDAHRHWRVLQLYLGNSSDPWSAMMLSRGLHYSDPTADPDFLEFCLNLNPKYQVVDGWPRWFARQVYSDIAPAEIAWSTKRGLQSCDSLDLMRPHLSRLHDEMSEFALSSQVGETLDLKRWKREFEAHVARGGSSVQDLLRLLALTRAHNFSRFLTMF